MKKSISKSWITWIIIFLVLFLSFYIIFSRNSGQPEISKELAKCIAQDSTLYTKTGCHYCELQEQMFGDNYQYLNVIHGETWDDLIPYNITATPTWDIKGEIHVGLLSKEKLIELTGC